jgi:hypothetical protein
MNKTKDYKDVYNTIKTDKITESTANMYTLNILKTFKNMKLDINNIKEAILDTDIIYDITTQHNSSLNTMKNKLVSILVFLKAIKANEKIIDLYTDEIDMISSRIQRQHKKLQKTEHEKENWYTKEKLLEKVQMLKDKLKKNIINDYDYLKDYMKYILLLIHISYPMRNDLSDAVIMNVSKFLKMEKDNKENYIIVGVNLGHIVLYNFKTVKSKGVQKILIDNLILKEIKKYKKVLDKYKKENDINNDYFIIKKNGQKITRNEYTKFFNQIFLSDNKKVSTTMIRKFIASDVWKMDSIKELANRMQHTPEQALKSYVKI